MVSAPISVIMPTYNRAAILPAAIRSVQAQTRPDWELVIVDDGSTDDTVGVVASFSRDDPRVRLIANTSTSGPGGARNAGIRAAGGSFIAFIDSDDLWEPIKLARFMEGFDAAPAAVLVGSDYRMVDHDQHSTTTMKSFVLDTMVPWWLTDPLAAEITRSEAIRQDIAAMTEPGLFVALTIAGFPWIHTTSAMVRRDTALAVGLFDERLQRTEDIDLWLKLERTGPFVYIDEVLAEYDITGRDGGAGARYGTYDPSRQHTKYIEARYHLRLLDRIERSCPLTADQTALLKRRRQAQHRRCAVEAMREGRGAGLIHAIRCWSNTEERDTLLREMKTIPPYDRLLRLAWRR